MIFNERKYYPVFNTKIKQSFMVREEDLPQRKWNEHEGEVVTCYHVDNGNPDEETFSEFFIEDLKQSWAQYL